MKKDLVVHEVFINREADRKKAALEQWLQMMGTRWTGKGEAYAMRHILPAEQGR